jgi:molybdenum cofactor cytidylyltransferase
VTPRIAALVLAAGRSSRMPTNKLLADFGGTAMIQRTVENVSASRAAPVIVVVGHSADTIRAALTGLPVTITENVSFADGLSSSLKCGVNALPPCDGFLVALGDMPLVTPEMIDTMIAAFDPAAGRSIIVPVFEGRRGNPVLWSAAFRDEFQTLSGDKGAKQLMALHGNLVYEVEVGSDAVLTDFDTPEDFHRR